MYLRLILGALIGCTAGLVGCADEASAGRDDGDGEPVFGQDNAGAVVTESRTLQLLSERRVGLAFGEETLLRVALTRSNDDAVVKGAHVSFAFQGIAQDSSLSSLDVATDAEGLAENTLMVGEFVGTFTVEISAPGAASVTVQVSVGNAGFGTVIVKAPYTGERQVRRRRIAIVPEVECADAEPNAGDHMELLAEPSDEAVFLLPAETDYAVVAFAHGLDDTVLALGCTLLEAVAADEETTVEVSFTDHILHPSGNYELEAELSSSEPAQTLGELLRQSAIAHVETDRDQVRDADGADARLLLDALEDLLRSDAYAMMGGAVLADSVTAERAMPSLMPPLQAQLQEALDYATPATGARIAAADLAEDTTESLSTVTLVAKLTIDGEDPDAPLSWDPLSVGTGVLDADEPGPAVDLSSQGLAEVSATLLQEDDSIDIQQARFGLPWGALASEVLLSILTKQTQAEPSSLRRRFGCDVFSTWIEATPLLTDGCDGDCAQEACSIALGRMVDASSADLIAVDEARPTVTMWGSLSLHDDTGDLAVERMAVDSLRGEWNDAPDGDAERFDGTASGEVLLNLIGR